MRAVVLGEVVVAAVGRVIGEGVCVGVIGVIFERAVLQDYFPIFPGEEIIFHNIAYQSHRNIVDPG